MRPISLRRWVRGLLRWTLQRLQDSTIRLGLFVAFVCLCLMVSAAWRTYEDLQREVSQVQRGMENLARSLVQHAEDTIELADLAVFGVVAHIENERMGVASMAELGPMLALRASATSRISGLFVFDAEGRWVASSLATRPNPVPTIESRDYFRHHLASPERGPLIGPVLRGQATGGWLLTVSRRFDRPDGEFAGIVVATIDMTYLSRHWAQFDVGSEGVIALFTPAGSLLARHPFDAALFGGSVVQDPLFRENPPRAYGTHTYVSPFDGIERLSGFARARSFPLLLTAAVSRSEALASWQFDAITQLASFGAICIIIAVLGAMLTAHVRSRQKLEQQLALMARTDSLTELPNRRALDHELQREWRRAARLGVELSVLMLDLDRFKAYNDSYGHLAGDACLRAVGAAIASTVGRARDFVARYGGEEIAVLLPDTSGPQAVLVAEKIRVAIEALAIPHAGNPPLGIVTASIGVATVFPLGEHDPARLIEAADKALYEAKEAGRNRIATAQGALLRVEAEAMRRTA